MLGCKQRSLLGVLPCQGWCRVRHCRHPQGCGEHSKCALICIRGEPMDHPWGEGAPAPLNRWKFGVQGCCIPWNCELGVVLRG